MTWRQVGRVPGRRAAAARAGRNHPVRPSPGLLEPAMFEINLVVNPFV